MSRPEEKVRFGYRTVAADEKKRLVQEQFDRIAGRYDRADALLSLGLHFSWKRATVRRLELRPGERVLDVCGGTGDLALRAARKVGPGGSAVICDLNGPMMTIGRKRAGAAAIRYGRIAFVRGDAERLPFPDASFDAATVGFGLRNLVDLDRGLREIARVLKPGGRFAGLEFTLPRRRWQRSLYAFYSFRLMLPAARLIVGSEGPFRYLAESIRVFAESGDISGGLDRAGLADIRVRPRTLGIVTIYSGRKPQEARHADDRR